MEAALRMMDNLQSPVSSSSVPIAVGSSSRYSFTTRYTSVQQCEIWQSLFYLCLTRALALLKYYEVLRGDKNYGKLLIPYKHIDKLLKPYTHIV
jgi:hypothetical protein